MPTQHPYQFRQPSPAGTPGFESFQGSKGGLFYFHYNDIQGKPLLFSRGYPSARRRSDVLNSARYQIGNPTRYHRLKEEEAYFFIIRNSKNEEIARSRPFSGAKERDLTMKTLQRETTREKSPDKGKEERPESRAVPHAANEAKTGSPPKTDMTAMRARHKFNLTFRRPAEGEPFLGEMEYPLTKEKITFKNVDLDLITAFLGRYLPPGTLPPPPAQIEEAGTEKDHGATQKIKPKHPSLQARPESHPAALTTEKSPKPKEGTMTETTPRPVAKRKIEVLKKGQPVSKPVFHKDETFALLLSLAPEEREQLAAARVLVKALGKNMPNRIIGVTSGKSGRTGDMLTLPFSFHGMVPGIYTLQTILTFQQKEKLEKEELIDNRLVQVID